MRQRVRAPLTLWTLRVEVSVMGREPRTSVSRSSQRTRLVRALVVSVSVCVHACVCVYVCACVCVYMHACMNIGEEIESEDQVS